MQSHLASSNSSHLDQRSIRHSHVFAGFALPTSNTTYTPNQFFDVCLPYYSRGVVRLVAYLIRKTLGWCDGDGNPQEQHILASYQDLITRAGISREMIRQAIDDAIAANFIICSRRPVAKKAGGAAVSGLYELKWDERAEYVKDPAKFKGFFAADGNRTYIPNQFFDVLVPRESIAVLKVVGSIIRFSIGFQNKWGHRRRNVALSYRHIQNYSLLKDRTSLSRALKHALESNYIERTEEGYFDPDAGRLSKAAVYAVKWLNGATIPMIGQKSPPEEISIKNRSEIPTDIGQKTRPADRSEIPTDIKIKQTNKTSKQQADIAAALMRLREEGFDTKAAQAIASKHAFEEISKQIGWIDARRVKRNRLGMLRQAIEENWAAPGGAQPRRPDPKRESGTNFTSALDQAKARLLNPSNQLTP